MKKDIKKAENSWKEMTENVSDIGGELTVKTK